MTDFDEITTSVSLPLLARRWRRYYARYTRKFSNLKTTENEISL